MQNVSGVRTTAVVIVACLFLGSTSEASKGVRPPECASTTGVASFYAGNFIGRKTASGRVFTSRAMTAAHKTLPFGTRLTLTNQKNGKSITVVVDDRGPYIAGRELDLSQAAAERLGFVDQGLADLKIESCKKVPASQKVPASIFRSVASSAKSILSQVR